MTLGELPSNFIVDFEFFLGKLATAPAVRRLHSADESPALCMAVFINFIVGVEQLDFVSDCWPGLVRSHMQFHSRLLLSVALNIAIK